MTSPLPVLPTAIDGWLQNLIQAPSLRFSRPVATPLDVRLIRLDAINEERHQAYRQALANVYAALDPTQPVRLLYLLDGGPTGVALYFGVVADSPEMDIHEAMKNLRGALEGQLPGINFGEEIDTTERQAIIERLCRAPQQGVMLGAPTGQAQDEASDEQNFQGIDRLVRALQSGSRPDHQSSGRWQLAVVSQPLTRQLIRELLDEAFRLSTQMAAMVRTSVQASGNTSRQKSASIGTSDADGSSKSRSDTRGKSAGGTETKTYGESSSSNLISKIPQPAGSSAPDAARRRSPPRASGWAECRDETGG